MNTDGQAKIWSYYQNQRPESFAWARPRLRFLAARIRRSPAPLKVLTVGAGDGFLEARLQENGHSVSCLDLDQETVQRLRSRGVDALCGNLAGLAHDSAFDYAVVSEVLEHVEPSELADGLRALHRALRPAGVLLVTVPRREDLERNMTVCPGCGQRHHVWGHRRSFTESELALLLEQSGFHEVRVEERFFVSYRQLNWGGRLAYGLKHLAWKLVGRPNADLKYYAEAKK